MTCDLPDYSQQHPAAARLAPSAAHRLLATDRCRWVYSLLQHGFWVSKFSVACCVQSLLKRPPLITLFASALNVGPHAARRRLQVFIRPSCLLLHLLTCLPHSYLSSCCVGSLSCRYHTASAHASSQLTMFRSHCSYTLCTSCAVTCDTCRYGMCGVCNRAMNCHFPSRYSSPVLQRSVLRRLQLEELRVTSPPPSPSSSLLLLTLSCLCVRLKWDRTFCLNCIRAPLKSSSAAPSASCTASTARNAVSVTSW